MSDSYLDTSTFGDVPELKILDDGDEVQLRVVSAELGKSKKDKAQLVIRLDSPDDPLVDDMYLYLTWPTEDLKQEDPKKFTKSVRYLNDFWACFGIDATSGVDIANDLVGSRGWCLIGQEEYEGQMKNKIKKFVKGA